MDQLIYKLVFQSINYNIKFKSRTKEIRSLKLYCEGYEIKSVQNGKISTVTRI